jgi:hypothetical protein
MSAFRALPSQPSLEFDRKEAKALLRRLQDREADALARALAFHPKLGRARTDVFALADAQLIVAREYGFASWPRLVQYHAQLERQRHARTEIHGRDFFESLARSWRRELADRRPGAARSVAAYVPRFYGEPVDAVFAAEVTDDEIRVAIARTYGAPSWQVLMERNAGDRASAPPSGLAQRLCGHIRMTVAEVESLIAQGADPRWTAPNGYTVLEHALLKYFHPTAVDVLLMHLAPPFRDAMWVHAGIGDVAGTMAFLDHAGHPLARVRADRPPFDVFGPGPLPALPNPSDDELLFEVFVVAMLNHRLGVMEALCARGFNVNMKMSEQPLVNVAAMNGWDDIVAVLVRAGADLDVRGFRPAQTAREIIAAREAH